MIAKLTHFPLNKAFLCLDCKSVGNSHCWCPACSSSALMSLSNVLDRKEEEKESKRG